MAPRGFVSVVIIPSHATLLYWFKENLLWV
jgi:hypothetical protein